MKYILSLTFLSCFGFVMSFGQGITSSVTNFKLIEDTITFTYKLKNNSKFSIAIDNIHERINVYEQSDLEFKPNRPVNYIYLINEKHEFPKANDSVIGKWWGSSPSIIIDDGTAVKDSSFYYEPVEPIHIINIESLSHNICGRYLLINVGETVELKIMSYLGCYIIDAGDINISMKYKLGKKYSKILYDFKTMQKKNKRLKAYSLYSKTVTSNVIKFRYLPIDNVDIALKKMYKKITY